jgi:hypothetical protein
MRTIITVIIAFIVFSLQQPDKENNALMNNETPNLSYTPLVKSCPQEVVDNKVKDIPYQYGRVYGNDLVIIGHNLWETTVVWIRLPTKVQQGDIIVLNDNHYKVKVQTNKTYWSSEGHIVIREHRQNTDGTSVIKCLVDARLTDEKGTDSLMIEDCTFRTVYKKPLIPR